MPCSNLFIDDLQDEESESSHALDSGSDSDSVDFDINEVCSFINTYI